MRVIHLSPLAGEKILILLLFVLLQYLTIYLAQTRQQMSLENESKKGSRKVVVDKNSNSEKSNRITYFKCNQYNQLSQFDEK